MSRIRILQPIALIRQNRMAPFLTMSRVPLSFQCRNPDLNLDELRLPLSAQLRGCELLMRKG
jgi:hypothetical protein